MLRIRIRFLPGKNEGSLRHRILALGSRLPDMPYTEHGAAVQTLPIGTAYPVWTGIGAVGTVVLGIIFFHEPVSFLRLFFITTLIASIIGLKIVS